MEILKQFGINPLLLAAQVVNFAILLFILKKLLYKPILKVLEERKQKIAESLKNAEEIERKLAETNEKIDEMMSKTSNEIQKLMDEAKKDREVYLAETKEKADQVTAEIIKKGEEAARLEAVKMEQVIMSKVADIVAAGLQKVTGKVLNRKDQKEIIEREIKNLS